MHFYLFIYFFLSFSRRKFKIVIFPNPRENIRNCGLNRWKVIIRSCLIKKELLLRREVSWFKLEESFFRNLKRVRFILQILIMLLTRGKKTDKVIGINYHVTKSFVFPCTKNKTVVIHSVELFFAIFFDVFFNLA